MNNFSVTCAQATLVAALCATTIAHAQPRPQLPGNYPTKPIRVVVSAPPGGSNDIQGRLILGKISEQWGYNFVMEHRVSGLGVINAVDIVAKANKDGYTLLVGSSSAIINVSLMAKVPYDVRKDLAPISLFTTTSYVLATSASLPVKSAKELIAHAKSKPGALSYASPGIGTSSHLAAELFNSVTGINMVHIPYKGTGPSMNDLIGGHVQALFGGATSVMPHTKTGKIRALGVTSLKRSAQLPDLPTIAESGVPGFEVSGWYSLMATGGSPARIVLALNQAITRVLRMPDVQEKLGADGAEIAPGTPTEFRDVINRDFEKWGKVITALKLNP